jgi:hypothetical protein
MMECVLYMYAPPSPQGKHKPPVLASITETSRIHVVLLGMRNRTFGPYLAAIHRTPRVSSRPSTTAHKAQIVAFYGLSQAPCNLLPSMDMVSLPWASSAFVSVSERACR